MIKNLNQLKRALRPGMRLEVIGHCRPGCIGQLREVTWVNTQGFYTKTLNPPDPKLNAANEGRGAILWWGAARTWEFEDGVCKSYTRSEHTAETLIISTPCTPGGSIWISALSGAINSLSSLMQCGMGRSIFWIW